MLAIAQSVVSLWIQRMALTRGQLVIDTGDSSAPSVLRAGPRPRLRGRPGPRVRRPPGARQSPAASAKSLSFPSLQEQPNAAPKTCLLSLIVSHLFIPRREEGARDADAAHRGAGRRLGGLSELHKYPKDQSRQKVVWEQNLAISATLEIGQQGYLYRQL